MSKLRFKRDPRGNVEVLGTPPHDVLAAYLSEEPQLRSFGGQRLLEVVRDLRGGRRGHWDLAGDAYSLELTPARATIHTEQAIPGRSVHLTLEEFEEEVRSWLEFLEPTPGP